MFPINHTEIKDLAAVTQVRVAKEMIGLGVAA